MPPLPDIAFEREPLFTIQSPKPTTWPVPVKFPSTMDEQAGAHLCWAAVAVAIARAYGKNTETQCDVTNRVLGPVCCAGPFRYPDATCDTPWDLPPALNAHCKRESRDAADRTDTYVKSQIDAGAPIAAHICWIDSQGGHFVVISGYIEVNGEFHLYIDEPLDGLRAVWVHTRFATAYQENGEWDITFETMP
jgi:hypothetical protein